MGEPRTNPNLPPTGAGTSQGYDGGRWKRLKRSDVDDEDEVVVVVMLVLMLVTALAMALVQALVQGAAWVVAAANAP